MIKEGLPIKCLEAVVLGMRNRFSDLYLIGADVELDLTNGLIAVDRFGKP